LERKREFEEHKGSDQRIQKGILTRLGRCGKARIGRKDI